MERETLNDDPADMVFTLFWTSGRRPTTGSSKENKRRFRRLVKDLYKTKATAVYFGKLSRQIGMTWDRLKWTALIQRVTMVGGLPELTLRFTTRHCVDSLWRKEDGYTPAGSLLDGLCTPPPAPT